MNGVEKMELPPDLSVSVHARDPGNDFAGFGALVIVLRLPTSKEISGFHIVLTLLYPEPVLFLAAF
jgi:hypothetical protein